MFNLNLIIKEQSDKCNKWDNLQNSYHGLFKEVNVVKKTKQMQKEVEWVHFKLKKT